MAGQQQQLKFICLTRCVSIHVAKKHLSQSVKIISNYLFWKMKNKKYMKENYEIAVGNKYYYKIAFAKGKLLCVDVKLCDFGIKIVFLCIFQRVFCWVAIRNQVTNYMGSLWKLLSF